jgi:hypothetical protein
MLQQLIGFDFYQRRPAPQRERPSDRVVLPVD